MKDYKGDQEGPGGRVPGYVFEAIHRQEMILQPQESQWQEALAFFDNDQYVERNAVTGNLDRVETRDGGRGKPRHRHRRTRNRFTPAITREVALCSSRVPVYECDPLNGDPLVTGEARLEEKVLLGAYQQMKLKSTACSIMQYSINVGAGFTWCYWNPDRGPIVGQKDGKVLRQGEMEVAVFHQGEVLWDGGEFEKSRWYATRKAQPVSRIMQRAGYLGPKDLTPDAQQGPHEARRGEEARDLAFVYEYLERPSAAHPKGRWLTICQGRLIAAEQPYPYYEPDGTPIDEPCLEWIPCIEREHRARPMGLGEMLVELQRDYNRTVSQITTFKDLALAPQMIAPIGSLRQKVDATPGAVYEYRPIGGQKPEWREVPEIPVSLFKSLDQIIADWAEITGQNQLPAGIESGSGVQAINERDQERRALFVSAVSDWYCAIGERMLNLMRCHWTEERLMVVRGRFGAESIQAFKGSKLRPVKVRVAEGSIMPRTRERQEAMIVNLMDRGLVDPKKGIAAIRAGTVDALIDAYELDVAKQNREIQQLVAMSQMRGQGVPFVDDLADDHPVHMEVLAMWMKTEDFEAMPALVQEAARAHYEMHDIAAFNKQMEAQMMSAGVAEQMGAQNAAVPQAQGTPMPSQPTMKTAAEGVELAGLGA